MDDDDKIVQHPGMLKLDVQYLKERMKHLEYLAEQNAQFIMQIQIEQKIIRNLLADMREKLETVK
jgi:hypothetical protein